MVLVCINIVYVRVHIYTHYWDSVKADCVYCGNDYKYACTASGNITGGSGTACGSRYTSCTCASGYSWNGSSCVKSTVTITVKTSYDGNYCGGGPYLSPDYKAPGFSTYATFPRATCSGQVDSTSLTAPAGGVLRVIANSYTGVGGNGIYPCSGIGSCAAYGSGSSKYYECYFTITDDTTLLFGYCLNSSSTGGCSNTCAQYATDASCYMSSTYRSCSEYPNKTGQGCMDLSCNSRWYCCW